MAASMTLDLGNTDKLNVFRQECTRLGIKILPPDINSSRDVFSVEETPTGPAIRYALAAVKGVGAQAMKAAVAERNARGPFKDLFDFARRLDPKSFNRRQFESLIKAGAFDALSANRTQSFSAIDMLLRHASAAANDRGSGQVSLFGGGEAGRGPMPALHAVADWPTAEKLPSASIFRATRSTFTPKAWRGSASSPMPSCRGSWRAAAERATSSPGW
jgi:DNA polymerase-3 subunit alpha